MPEENLPPKNLIPRAELDALKTRVALHIDAFCQELFPYGYLAPRGGYWVVPRRYTVLGTALGISIKISLGRVNAKGKKNALAGAVFNDDEPQARNPITDIIELWRAEKGYTTFKQAVATLRRWCSEIEKRNAPVVSLDPGCLVALDEERYEDLRSIVFLAVFGDSDKTEHRNSARQFWVKVLLHCRDKLGWTGHIQYPIEFCTGPKFLQLLRDFEELQDIAEAYFTVTEKKWITKRKNGKEVSKSEFILRLLD